MEIQIDSHTLKRAKQRGTNKQEIKDVISNGSTIPAKYDRKGKAKVYSFKQKRLGKYYKQKKVEVYYIEENNVIVTVTVYVFYGEWKEEK
ncbi:MAG: DUF4258 domain-containing protein [Elusimicrobia bacterium]|jgi:hypothetical protein|nr:DUF4258 domain-containing protein [Elusimicrobiota bacterium]